MLDWLLKPRQEYIDSLCSTIARAQRDNDALSKQLAHQLRENSDLKRNYALLEKQFQDYKALMQAPKPVEPEWAKDVDWERVPNADVYRY